MDERFIYLLLDIPFLLAAGVVFWKRPDLRRFIIKVGIVGGIAGLLSEIWYFQDYWRPINIFGTIAVPSIEDFLFGAGVVALGAVAPLFLLRQKQPARGMYRRRNGLILIVSILAAQLFFTNLLHINSIVASYIIFVVIAIIAIVRQPRLLKPALLSGLVLVVVASVSYNLVNSGPKTPTTSKQTA